MEDVYELFVRGTELLEAGHNHQATIPLARARDLAPDKTSIREALGRALRAQLRAGLGLGGAVRALWALPPRPQRARRRPGRRSA